MADEVLVEHIDRIAIITINRPRARNAINYAVSAGVSRALEELDERADLTVGIITGAGGTFSSGMDLKAFLAGETVSVEGKGLAGLTRCPPRKPLIAAVEGWALAGGYRLGLVNALTEPGKALDGARQLAARIAANGPLAVAATKQIVAQQHDWDLADAWEQQEPILLPAFESEDAREGALAFTEKRTPVWKGR